MRAFMYTFVKARLTKLEEGHWLLISPSSKKTECFCEIIKVYFTKFPESMPTGRSLRKIGKNGVGTNRKYGGYLS